MSGTEGRLAGRRALVTAAGQGMGRAIAVAFANAGAHVLATDVDGNKLRDLAGRPSIEVGVLDVSSRTAIADLAARSRPIDVLANVAGWVHHGNILECTEEDWQRTLDVNVTSMFRLIRTYLPGMIERKRGSIVNIASVQSSIIANEHRLAYGASKAAVIGLTKSVALAHAKQGVRCNVICPGVIDTPTVRDRIAAVDDPDKERGARLARHPLGRFGSSEEIAAMAVHLASDEAGFTTGAVIVVDGGYTL
jgi:2-keto-3-deoxy-L-fuconate dehydrogenase